MKPAAFIGDCEAILAVNVLCKLSHNPYPKVAELRRPPIFGMFKHTSLCSVSRSNYIFHSDQTT